MTQPYEDGEPAELASFEARVARLYRYPSDGTPLPPAIVAYECAVRSHRWNELAYAHDGFPRGMARYYAKVVEASRRLFDFLRTQGFSAAEAQRLVDDVLARTEDEFREDVRRDPHWRRHRDQERRVF